MLYRHTLPEGGSMLVRRMTVANRAELITAFCVACAESIGTHQVLCFQRNLAVGEVVGIKNGHKDIPARRLKAAHDTRKEDETSCQRRQRFRNLPALRG